MRLFLMMDSPYWWGGIVSFLVCAFPGFVSYVLGAMEFNDWGWAWDEYKSSVREHPCVIGSFTAALLLFLAWMTAVLIAHL